MNLNILPEFSTFDDNVLYHYTKLPNLISMLYNDTSSYGSFRFSRFLSANDPKESNISYIKNESVDDERECKREQDFIAEVFRLYYETIQYASFSIDKEDKENATKHNTIENAYKNKGFNKPRMWAQYAGNGEGVCILFNKKKLLTAIDELGPICVLQGKISYRYPVTAGTLASILYPGEDIAEEMVLNRYDPDEANKYKDIKEYAYQHLKKFNEFFFFTKSTDWAEEDEYRILCLNICNSVRQSIVVPLNKDTVKGIILGDKANLCCYKLLDKCMNIPIYRMEYYHSIAVPQKIPF